MSFDWTTLPVHPGIRQLYSNPDGSPTSMGKALGWPGLNTDGHCLGLRRDTRVGPRCRFAGVTPRIRDRKMVRVAEDWAPTYWDGVEVSLIAPAPLGQSFDQWPDPADCGWVVSVWGADDEGMCTGPLTEARARTIFDRIKDLVTKANLRAMGFGWS